MHYAEFSFSNSLHSHYLCHCQIWPCTMPNSASPTRCILITLCCTSRSTAPALRCRLHLYPQDQKHRALHCHRLHTEQSTQVACLQAENIDKHHHHQAQRQPPSHKTFRVSLAARALC